MNRVAQATIFIIVAVILVGTASIAFFVLKKNTDVSSEFAGDPQVQVKFNSIRTSVGDCIKFTSNNALNYIGVQGGYYTAPKNSFDFGWAAVSYYYKDNKILMPTNSEIQTQLGLYVNGNIKSCIKSLGSDEFKISYLEANTNVEIKETEVLFKVNMPVIIQRGTKSVKFELKDYPVSIPSKLFSILEVARYITDSHKENMLCIDCLANLSQTNGVVVDFINLEDNTRFVVITEDSKQSDPLDAYAFEFLEEYKKGDPNVGATKVPEPTI